MLLLKFRRFRLVGQPYAVWALVCFCLCALATATPAQTSTASLPPDRNRVELEAVDTWTDPLTGLMWAKKSSDQEVNWRQAIKYCKALQLGGYNDWYLPTIDELKPLFSVFENNWAVRGSQHLSGWNWSSSSAENGPGTVWSINLSPSGGVPNFSRDERGGMHALCVRRPTEKVKINDSIPAVSTQYLSSINIQEFYVRPVQTSLIPGRISEDQLKVTFKAFVEAKQQAVKDLISQATRLSDTLRSIQSQVVHFNPNPLYNNFMTSPGFQRINELQRRLGIDLKPRDVKDIQEMNAVLRHPDSTVAAFCPGNCDEVHSAMDQAIEREKRQQDILSNGQQLVVEVEQSLDQADLSKAEGYFQKMSSDGSIAELGPIKQYLELNRPLQEDLASYVKLLATHNDMARSLGATIHYIATNEAALTTAANAPITASYLAKWTVEDKASLRVKLDSLPAFQSNVKTFVCKHVHATSTDKQFVEQYDSASKDWEQLKRDLEAAHDLVEITSDQAAMQSIRSWYGSEFSDSLMTKGTGVEAAKGNETALMVYVGLATGVRERLAAAESERLASIQRQHEQAEARKQALIDERNNLAGTIWNKVIMITMLDDKFETTQVMGYTMESDKQRDQLNTLLRRDAAMLTPSLWNEVNTAYQHMLPGLTVWQASHARSIIAGLRSR